MPRVHSPCWFDSTHTPDRLHNFSFLYPLAVCGSLEARTTIAIVGTREPIPDSEHYAFDLAQTLARAGAVIVSGGALGIDAAAHRGALAAGGRTWCVLPSGHPRTYPPEHDVLVHEILESRGAVLWTGPTDRDLLRAGFHYRNRVLVALSDAVVIVQAGMPSGSLHTARIARTTQKPLFVVPAFPWSPNFRGSLAELERGAIPLTRERVLLDHLRLSGAPIPLKMKPPGTDETLWRTLSNTPQHPDVLAEQTGLSVHVVLAQLLTLSLEDVVVEVPGGYRLSSKPLK